jgi:glutaredoxin 3
MSNLNNGPDEAAPVPQHPRGALLHMLDMAGGRGFKWRQKTDKKGNHMSQPKVEIYTKAWCGFCTRAKRLLEEKGVDFVEYDVTMGGPEKEEMLQRKPDARTVPQIFIDGKSIGGSDDLARLERDGKLDALLGL